MKLVLSLFACIGVQSIQAAVSYVGFENGFGPTYTAQRWSNTSEPKAFNTDPSERYGTSGYYYLAPKAPAGPGLFATGVGGNINLHGTLLIAPTALSANPTIINGNWVNFSGYAITNNPDGSNVDRIGAMSAGVQAGGNYGFFNDFVYLPVLAGRSFRFGIMVDTLDGAQYGSSAVSIYDPTNGSVTYSSTLVMNAIPELVFFDIANTSAITQTYSVALHRPDAGTSAFSVLTFDPVAVPEPATWMFGAVLCTMVFIGHRKLLKT